MLNAAPKEDGTLDLIVMRPDHDKRVLPDVIEVCAEDGVPWRPLETRHGVCFG